MRERELSRRIRQFLRLGSGDVQTLVGGQAYNPQNVAITGGNVAYSVRCSIPFLRSPTGNMGNNGAYVSGTAFAKTYPKCYIYFGAAQIAAGSTAGWYYAEGSSTTAFTVFNNTYTTGTPSLPASKTAFVTTGPGAITGDTTEQGVLPLIAANQLGNSGGWRLEAKWSHANSAGSKNPRLRYSGSGGTQLAGQTASTTAASWAFVRVFNQQSTAVQSSAGWVANSSSSGYQNADLTVDTTAATNPAVTATMATATDYIVIEWWQLDFLTDGT